VSIPLTIAVVGSYVLWDWKLSKKAGKEDEAIELQMLDMMRNSRSQAVRIAACGLRKRGDREGSSGKGTEGVKERTVLGFKQDGMRLDSFYSFINIYISSSPFFLTH
jgi:hypothetical protein